MVKYERGVLRESHVYPSAPAKCILHRLLDITRAALGALLSSSRPPRYRDLNGARANNSGSRRSGTSAPDQLIIDDFRPKSMNFARRGLLRDRRRAASARFHHRSPADWLPLFPDPVMANSALDRLAHKAHHVVMIGESYRAKNQTAVSRTVSTFTGPTED